MVTPANETRSMRAQYQSADHRRSPRTWWEDVEKFTSVFALRKEAAQRGLRVVRVQYKDSLGNVMDVWKLGEPVTF